GLGRCRAALVAGAAGGASTVAAAAKAQRRAATVAAVTGVATVAAVGVRGAGVVRSGARAATGRVGGRVPAVGLATVGAACLGLAAGDAAGRRIRAVVAGIAAVGLLLRQVDRDRIVLAGVGRAVVQAGVGVRAGVAATPGVSGRAAAAVGIRLGVAGLATARVG